MVDIPPSGRGPDSGCELAGPHAALRLPLDFDPEPLVRDLARVTEERWIPHVNEQDYSGDWSGAALRGPGWATHPVQSLLSIPDERDWKDTDLMAACPAFEAALARFECALLSVRLLRLGPCARIHEHRDPGSLEGDGEARLHVPVVTHPAVDFRIAGERLALRAGETWYLDATRPHAVTNASPVQRVHLVLDCLVNDWLRELLGRALAC